VTPEEDELNRWLPAAQSPPPAAAVRDEPVRDERSRSEPGDWGSVEQTEAITAQDADHSQHVGHEQERGDGEAEFGWPEFNETARATADDSTRDEPQSGILHDAVTADAKPDGDVDPAHPAESAAAEPAHPAEPAAADPAQHGDGPSPGHHDDHERSPEPAPN